MSNATSPSNATPALKVEDISKTFAGKRVLDRLSLRIPAGEVHALVGQNGSGKSSFVKILAGYQAPDDTGGCIVVAGTGVRAGSAHSSYQAGCRFVHQDLALLEDATVLENLCLDGGYVTLLQTIRTGQSRRQARAQLDQIGLEVSPDATVGRLSAAEKTGVAIARAMRRDERYPLRLLVLDEPTATLPEPEVDRLCALVRKVAATGASVLYVSHRLEEIFALAQTVSVLRDGVTVATRRTGTLQRRELIELVAGEEIGDLDRRSDRPSLRAASVPLLRVAHLSTSSVSDVSFTVDAGEVVGVAGITGSGREQILSAIFGGSARSGGRVIVGARPLPAGQPGLSVRSGLAYLPPDRHRLGGLMTLSARENLTIADLRPIGRRAWIRSRRERATVKSWFSRLEVRPPDAAESALSTFSGGNQQKILFAKWLRLVPQVFLLDEPTQGVDIGAKALLHRQLKEAARGGMAIVVSSSDTEELAAICTRVLVLRHGRIVADLEGGAITVSRLSRAALSEEGEG